MTDLPGLALALIEEGSKVNALDNEEQSPLHTACFMGYAAATPLLIEAKAALDLQDKDGQTPLHFAYSSKEPGDVENAALLIRAGARTDIKNLFDNTPAALGSPETIEAVNAALERKGKEDLDLFKTLYMALCIKGVKLKSDEEPKNMPDTLLPMFLSKAAQKTRSEKVASHARDLPASERRTHSL